jgi:hypothetical protein
MLLSMTVDGMSEQPAGTAGIYSHWPRAKEQAMDEASMAVVRIVFMTSRPLA